MSRGHPLSRELGGSGGSIVVVFGVSSQLGMALSRRLSTLRCVAQVIGTYRTWRPGLNSLATAFTDKGKALELRPLDVMDDVGVQEVVREVCARAEVSGSELTLVYCCGAWCCGPLRELDGRAFDRVIGVGLRAPFVIASAVMRRCPTALRLLLVTGLGGEKNFVRHNTVYGLCTNAVYGLVKSVSLELDATRSSCVGIALSLIDRGQPYLPDFLARTGLRIPTDFTRAVDLITTIVSSRLDHFNGTVVELADGLSTYAPLLEYLAGEAPASADPVNNGPRA